METERCKELRMMLYSDMKEGIVSKEDYVELHAAYGKRLRNAEESIRAIQKEMDNMLEKADASNTWLDYFVKYQDMEVLTRTVIVELIREIRVHDKRILRSSLTLMTVIRHCLHSFRLWEWRLQQIRITICRSR